MSGRGLRERLPCLAVTVRVGHDCCDGMPVPGVTIAIVRSKRRDSSRRMPTDLRSFGLTEMLRCSVALRHAASGAPSMEKAAKRICRFLYTEFGAVSSAAGASERIGGGDCALVRLYKTHPYARLEPSLRRFADKALGEGK